MSKWSCDCRMLAVITPVFIPQTKYTEQWSAGQAGSRGVSGHSGGEMLESADGQSWERQHWHRCRLQPLQTSWEWPWCDHNIQWVESSKLADNSQLMRPDLVWDSLSLEVKSKKWGVKSEDWDWGHFLENFCKLSAAAATEAENNQRN